jgi:hypothetical protein
VSSRRVLVNVATLADSRRLAARRGLGHYFTELAAEHGALVTAIAGSADRGTRLLELGAVCVLPDVESAVRPQQQACQHRPLSRSRHPGRLSAASARHRGPQQRTPHTTHPRLTTSPPVAPDSRFTPIVTTLHSDATKMPQTPLKMTPNT